MQDTNFPVRSVSNENSIHVSSTNYQPLFSPKLSEGSADTHFHGIHKQNGSDSHLSYDVQFPPNGSKEPHDEKVRPFQWEALTKDNWSSLNSQDENILKEKSIKLNAGQLGPDFADLKNYSELQSAMLPRDPKFARNGQSSGAPPEDLEEGWLQMAIEQASMFPNDVAQGDAEDSGCDEYDSEEEAEGDNDRKGNVQQKHSTKKKQSPSGIEIEKNVEGKSSAPKEKRKFLFIPIPAGGGKKMADVTSAALKVGEEDAPKNSVGEKPEVSRQKIAPVHPGQEVYPNDVKVYNEPKNFPPNSMDLPRIQNRGANGLHGQTVGSAGHQDIAATANPTGYGGTVRNKSSNSFAPSSGNLSNSSVYENFSNPHMAGFNASSFELRPQKVPYFGQQGQLRTSVPNAHQHALSANMPGPLQGNIPQYSHHPGLYSIGQQGLPGAMPPNMLQGYSGPFPAIPQGNTNQLMPHAMQGHTPANAQAVNFVPYGPMSQSFQNQSASDFQLPSQLNGQQNNFPPNVYESGFNAHVTEALVSVSESSKGTSIPVLSDHKDSISNTPTAQQPNVDLNPVSNSQATVVPYSTAQQDAAISERTSSEKLIKETALKDGQVSPSVSGKHVEDNITVSSKCDTSQLNSADRVSETHDTNYTLHSTRTSNFNTAEEKSSKLSQVDGALEKDSKSITVKVFDASENETKSSSGVRKSSIQKDRNGSPTLLPLLAKKPDPGVKSENLTGLKRSKSSQKLNHSVGISNTSTVEISGDRRRTMLAGTKRSSSFSAESFPISSNHSSVFGGKPTRRPYSSRDSRGNTADSLITLPLLPKHLTEAVKSSSDVKLSDLIKNQDARKNDKSSVQLPASFNEPVTVKKSVDSEITSSGNNKSQTKRNSETSFGMKDGLSALKKKMKKQTRQETKHEMQRENSMERDSENVTRSARRLSKEGTFVLEDKGKENVTEENSDTITSAVLSSEANSPGAEPQSNALDRRMSTGSNKKQDANIQNDTNSDAQSVSVGKRLDVVTSDGSSSTLKMAPEKEHTFSKDLTEREKDKSSEIDNEKNERGNSNISQKSDTKDSEEKIVENVKRRASLMKQNSRNLSELASIKATSKRKSLVSNSVKKSDITENVENNESSSLCGKESMLNREKTFSTENSPGTKDSNETVTPVTATENSNEHKKEKSKENALDSDTQKEDDTKSNDREKSELESSPGGKCTPDNKSDGKNSSDSKSDRKSSSECQSDEKNGSGSKSGKELSESKLDGKDSSDSKSDGKNSSEIKSDGKDSSEIKSDGKNSFEIKSDGKNGSESKSDGKNSSEIKSDGKDSSERKSDGRENSESEPDGKNGSESKSDGKNSSEIKSDGKDSSERKSDGRENSESEPDGKNGSESKSDGKNSSEIKSDGKENSESEPDGKGNSESMSDGKEISESKSDGKESSESKSGGKDSSESKSDGKASSESKSDGKESPESKSDGKESSESRSDGKEMSESKSDGKESSESKSDGKESSESKSDGKDSSESKPDGKDNSESKSDGKASSESKSDGKESSESKSGGQESSESKSDGKDSSQSKPDGKDNSESKSDGKASSESESDGKESSESKSGGKESSESKPGGKDSSQSNPDGKESSESKPGGKDSSQSKPDGKDSSQSKPDGKESSESKSDGKESSESKSDGKERSESKSNGKESSESKSDRKETSKSRSDGKESSGSKSGEKNGSESKSDRRNSSGSNSGGKNSTESKPDGKNSTKSKSDRKTSSERKSDGKTSSEIGSDGKSSSERKSGEKNSSDSNSGGKNSSESMLDRKSDLESDSVGKTVSSDEKSVSESNSGDITGSMSNVDAKAAIKSNSGENARSRSDSDGEACTDQQQAFASNEISGDNSKVVKSDSELSTDAIISDKSSKSSDANEVLEKSSSFEGKVDNNEIDTIATKELILNQDTAKEEVQDSSTKMDNKKECKTLLNRNSRNYSELEKLSTASKKRGPTVNDISKSSVEGDKIADDSAKSSVHEKVLNSDLSTLNIEMPKSEKPENESKVTDSPGSHLTENKGIDLETEKNDASVEPGKQILESEFSELKMRQQASGHEKQDANEAIRNTYISKATDILTEERSTSEMGSVENSGVMNGSVKDVWDQSGSDTQSMVSGISKADAHAAFRNAYVSKATEILSEKCTGPGSVSNSDGKSSKSQEDVKDSIEKASSNTSDKANRKSGSNLVKNSSNAQKKGEQNDAGSKGSSNSESDGLLRKDKGKSEARSSSGISERNSKNDNASNSNVQGQQPIADSGDISKTEGAPEEMASKGESRVTARRDSSEKVEKAGNMKSSTLAPEGNDTAQTQKVFGVSVGNENAPLLAMSNMSRRKLPSNLQAKNSKSEVSPSHESDKASTSSTDLKVDGADNPDLDMVVNQKDSGSDLVSTDKKSEGVTSGNAESESMSKTGNNTKLAGNTSVKTASKSSKIDSSEGGDTLLKGEKDSSQQKESLEKEKIVGTEKTEGTSTSSALKTAVTPNIVKSDSNLKGENSVKNGSSMSDKKTDEKEQLAAAMKGKDADINSGSKLESKDNVSSKVDGKSNERGNKDMPESSKVKGDDSQMKSKGTEIESGKRGAGSDKKAKTNNMEKSVGDKEGTVKGNKAGDTQTQKEILLNQNVKGAEAETAVTKKKVDKKASETKKVSETKSIVDSDHKNSLREKKSENGDGKQKEIKTGKFASQNAAKNDVSQNDTDKVDTFTSAHKSEAGGKSDVKNEVDKKRKVDDESKENGETGKLHKDLGKDSAKETSNYNRDGNKTGQGNLKKREVGKENVCGKDAKSESKDKIDVKKEDVARNTLGTSDLKNGSKPANGAGLDSTEAKLEVTKNGKGKEAVKTDPQKDKSANSNGQMAVSGLKMGELGLAPTEKSATNEYSQANKLMNDNDKQDSKKDEKGLTSSKKSSPKSNTQKNGADSGKDAMAKGLQNLKKAKKSDAVTIKSSQKADTQQEIKTEKSGESASQNNKRDLPGNKDDKNGKGAQKSNQNSAKKGTKSAETVVSEEKKEGSSKRKLAGSSQSSGVKNGKAGTANAVAVNNNQAGIENAGPVDGTVKTGVKQEENTKSGKNDTTLKDGQKSQNAADFRVDVKKSETGAEQKKNNSDRPWEGESSEKPVPENADDNQNPGETNTTTGVKPSKTDQEEKSGKLKTENPGKQASNSPAQTGLNGKAISNDNDKANTKEMAKSRTNETEVVSKDTKTVGRKGEVSNPRKLSEGNATAVERKLQSLNGNDISKGKSNGNEKTPGDVRKMTAEDSSNKAPENSSKKTSMDFSKKTAVDSSKKIAADDSKTISESNGKTLNDADAKQAVDANDKPADGGSKMTVDGISKKMENSESKVTENRKASDVKARKNEISNMKTDNGKETANVDSKKAENGNGQKLSEDASKKMENGKNKLTENGSKKTENVDDKMAENGGKKTQNSANKKADSSDSKKSAEEQASASKNGATDNTGGSPNGKNGVEGKGETKLTNTLNNSSAILVKNGTNKNSEVKHVERDNTNMSATNKDAGAESGDGSNKTEGKSTESGKVQDIAAKSDQSSVIETHKANLKEKVENSEKSKEANGENKGKDKNARSIEHTSKKDGDHTGMAVSSAVTGETTKVMVGSNRGNKSKTLSKEGSTKNGKTAEAARKEGNEQNTMASDCSTEEAATGAFAMMGQTAVSTGSDSKTTVTKENSFKTDTLAATLVAATISEKEAKDDKVNVANSKNAGEEVVQKTDNSNLNPAEDKDESSPEKDSPKDDMLKSEKSTAVETEEKSKNSKESKSTVDKVDTKEDTLNKEKYDTSKHQQKDLEKTVEDKDTKVMWNAKRTAAIPLPASCASFAGSSTEGSEMQKKNLGNLNLALDAGENSKAGLSVPESGSTASLTASPTIIPQKRPRLIVKMKSLLPLPSDSCEWDGFEVPPLPPSEDRIDPISNIIREKGKSHWWQDDDLASLTSLSSQTEKPYLFPVLSRVVKNKPLSFLSTFGSSYDKDAPYVKENEAIISMPNPVDDKNTVSSVSSVPDSWLPKLGSTAGDSSMSSLNDDHAMSILNNRKYNSSVSQNNILEHAYGLHDSSVSTIGDCSKEDRVSDIIQDFTVLTNQGLSLQSMDTTSSKHTGSVFDHGKWDSAKRITEKERSNRKDEAKSETDESKPSSPDQSEGEKSNLANKEKDGVDTCTKEGNGDKIADLNKEMQGKGEQEDPADAQKDEAQSISLADSTNRCESTMTPVEEPEHCQSLIEKLNQQSSMAKGMRRASLASTRSSNHQSAEEVRSTCSEEDGVGLIERLRRQSKVSASLQKSCDDVQSHDENTDGMSLIEQLRNQSCVDKGIRRASAASYNPSENGGEGDSLSLVEQLRNQSRVDKGVRRASAASCSRSEGSGSEGGLSLMEQLRNQSHADRGIRRASAGQNDQEENGNVESSGSEEAMSLIEQLRNQSRVDKGMRRASAGSHDQDENEEENGGMSLIEQLRNQSRADRGLRRASTVGKGPNGNGLSLVEQLRNRSQALRNGDYLEEEDEEEGPSIIEPSRDQAQMDKPMRQSSVQENGYDSGPNEEGLSLIERLRNKCQMEVGKRRTSAQVDSKDGEGNLIARFKRRSQNMKMRHTQNDDSGLGVGAAQRMVKVRSAASPLPECDEFDGSVDGSSEATDTQSLPVEETSNKQKEQLRSRSLTSTRNVQGALRNQAKHTQSLSNITNKRISVQQAANKNRHPTTLSTKPNAKSLSRQNSVVSSTVDRKQNTGRRHSVGVDKKRPSLMQSGRRVVSLSSASAVSTAMDSSEGSQDPNSSQKDGRFKPSRAQIAKPGLRRKDSQNVKLAPSANKAQADECIPSEQNKFQSVAIVMDERQPLISPESVEAKHPAVAEVDASEHPKSSVTAGQFGDSSFVNPVMEQSQTSPRDTKIDMPVGEGELEEIIVDSDKPEPPGDDSDDRVVTETVITTTTIQTVQLQNGHIPSNIPLKRSSIMDVTILTASEAQLQRAKALVTARHKALFKKTPKFRERKKRFYERQDMSPSRLMNEPVPRLKGYKKWKHHRKLEYRRFKDRMADSFSALIIWNRSFKQIEGAFGMGICSYFRFLKFLFLLNIFIALIMIVVTTIPQVIFAPPTFNESLQLLNLTAESDMPVASAQLAPSANASGNITAAMAQALLSPTARGNYIADALSCSANYTNFTDDVKENATPLEGVLSFLQGDGWMMNTLLYIGFYFNKTVYNFDPYMAESYHPVFNFNMPLAYILATGAYFFFSLVVMVKHIGEGFRQNTLKGEGRLFVYCNNTFGGWDYCINTDKAARMKHNILFADLTRDLENERMKERRANRSTREKCCLYFIRLIVNIIVITVLCGAGYLIFLSNKYSLEWGQKPDLNNFLKLLVEYMAPLVISILNFLIPMMFVHIVRPEDYTPEFEIRMTLLRTVFLRLASLTVLVLSLYTQITNCDETVCGNCQDTALCWESYVGQQFYKLVMLDFFIPVGIGLLVEFPRKLIWNKFHKRKVVKLLGQQQFNISKQVLDIVYSQTLCWIGAFFCPIIPAITVVKFFVLFYIKKYVLLLCCVPSSRTLRASNSNAFFTSMLLLSFVLTCIPVGWSIAKIPPSQSCGPFRIYSNKDYFMFDTISNTIATWPDEVRDAFYFLGSPAFYAPLVVLLLILIYYYYCVASGHDRMIQILKDELAMEGKDKKFLLDRVYEAQMRKEALSQQAIGS